MSKVSLLYSIDQHLAKIEELDATIAVAVGAPKAITLIEYDADGNIIYVGQHENLDAPTSDPNWQITKFEYDAQGNLVAVKKRTGSWDDRAVGW